MLRGKLTMTWELGNLECWDAELQNSLSFYFRVLAQSLQAQHWPDVKYLST